MTPALWLALPIFSLACRDRHGVRPDPGQDDTGAALLVDEISPDFATTLGGTEALIGGGPFDPSVRVFLDEREVEVLDVTDDAIAIRLPAFDQAGRLDVRVESELGEGLLADGLRIFQDGTGLGGAFGAIEWYELQGDYWTDDSRSWGTAWWGLIEPQDLHYWEVFGDEQDACVLNPAFPEMQVMDLGVDSTRLLSPRGELELSVAQDAFFDAAPARKDFALDGVWSVPSIEGGELPAFAIDELARTPGTFELLSPDMSGERPVSLAKDELIVEWSEVDADQVLVMVRRLDQDLEEIEVIGCTVQNDGRFRVPAWEFEQAWTADEWLYIYVGAVREEGGILPLNNAESRVAGVYWLLGAAVSAK